MSKEILIELIQLLMAPILHYSLVFSSHHILNLNSIFSIYRVYPNWLDVSRRFIKDVIKAFLLANTPLCKC